MASPASSEASEIRRRGRQRLIGAIALVMLLVVFVPMIIDSEPRTPRPEPALAIPPKDNAPPLPAPPAPAKAAKAAEKAPEKAVEKTAEKAPPAPATAVVQPVEKAAAAPKAAPAPAPGKAAAPTPAKTAAGPPLEGFAVQVGAFRDEVRLKQAREKLAAAGVVHYTERLESAGGPLTRLRAGPFPTREAAEAALARLKRAALDGKVVTLP